MAEWYMQNYKIITVFLAAVCLVVLYFAIRSSRRHKKLYSEEEGKIIRLKELKEKFSELSPSVISSADSAELLEGTALHYQLILQKKADIEKEFSLLPLCAQYVYVLDIFSSEGGVPSKFYKENGNILRELFAPALKEIGEEKLSKTVLPLARMYDPDDESASIDSAVIEKVDADFASAYNEDEFKLKAADYIRSQAQNFV